MVIPYDEKLATYTQLPLQRYTEPGPPGTYDADFFIDWGSTVLGTVHVGDDIKASPGTPVYTVAHGVLKYAAERGSPATKNWGWVSVIEHTFRNGQRYCSIYGHAEPIGQYKVGDFIPIGTVIAKIKDYRPNLATWANHLHFGVYYGSFNAKPGTYPAWLKGYAKKSEFPVPPSRIISGHYIDPLGFCRYYMPVNTADKTPGLGGARKITSNTPLEGDAIDHPDDEDYFRFAGRAGQRISLSVTRESGDMSPQIALYESRDGKHLTHKIAGFDIISSRQYFSTNSWRAAITEMPLPSTREYIFKIRSFGKTKGSYRFTKRVV